MAMTYARTGPVPDNFRFTLSIDAREGSEYRELAKWLWEHPNFMPEIVRRGLEQLRRAGALDTIASAVDPKKA